MMEHAKRTLSTFLHGRHSATFVILWSFILSILVSSFIKISPLVAVLFFIIALGIFGAEKLYYGEISKEIFLLCILFASLGLGSLRYSIKDFHEIHIPSDTGVVASEPEHRDASTRFIFKADNGERVLVSTDRLSDVSYGDRVEVDGSFKQPGVIVDEVSGREFDYGKYLSVQDIYYTSNFAHVQKISEDQLVANSPTPDREQATGSRLIALLLKIKSSFVSHIRSIFPEPQASLLAGLIVAGKEALPGNVLDDFKRAGVVHIVVLSGYNVTIIAEFFLLLLGFLGTRRAAIFSAIGIILFTLMTGATATVVRAAIMVLLLLFGKIIKRPYAPGRVLLFTAALMLLWNPKSLVYDPSFQLTFLAMIALVYVVPLVKALAEKQVPTPGQEGKSRSLASLLEVLYVTIATQVTVLPYLLYSVGSISLVSLISNILILLFVPFTMLVGFVAVLISYLSSILAWPFAFVTAILLKYILFVAHFLGNLSWASVVVSLPAWGGVMLYTLFIIILVYIKKRTRTFNSSSGVF